MSLLFFSINVGYTDATKNIYEYREYTHRTLTTNIHNTTLKSRTTEIKHKNTKRLVKPISKNHASTLPKIPPISCHDSCQLPIWPTPNTAFIEGKPLETYIQPTCSGRIESGLYGCVRDEGKRFHEGIDIKSIHRDRRNIPQDKVWACLSGKVAYLNINPKKSSYGRYIVLEHEDKGIHFYTLYAHLASIAPNLKAGQFIKQGTILGQMGHSSNFNIPLDRAHLHFEIGLKLSSYINFERWYRQNFKDTNFHGEWNGMNLTGLDPLQFFRSRVSFSTFLKQQPIAFTLKIPSETTPPFISHNPGCVFSPLPQSKIYGWEVDFNWVGAPIYWRQITQPMASKKIIIVKYNLYELQRFGNRHTLEFNILGQPILGNVQKRQLFELFGENLNL